MIYKIIISTILIFWITMTTWLVTSTFYPEFERLPKVQPALILDKFLESDEVTHLFVYEGEKNIGDGMLSSRLKGDLESEAEIRFVGKGQLDFPDGNSRRVNVRISVFVGTAPTRKLKDINFRISLQDPDVNMLFSFDTNSYDFNYQIMEGDQIIADSNKEDENPEIQEARELLKLLKLNSNQNSGDQQSVADGRWGSMEIAGHRTPVYFLVLDIAGTGKIKFTISEAGEFIEMKTPFGYDLKSKVIMKGNKIQP
jgi:hypothetical protein